MTERTLPAESSGEADEARARLTAELEQVFLEDPPVTRDDVSRETLEEEQNDVSRETRRYARFIGIVNQKGGVGKTTTAVNLGASLAAAEQKTLLVDIDPQGNATSGLGIERGEIGTSIYEVLVEGRSIEEAILPASLEALEIVPATVDLFGAEIELVGEVAREHRLKESLQSIRSRYDYVLVDCPPSLGLLTVNALTAVDSVLIPIQCEYYALEGLSQLLGTIRIVQRNLNPDLEVEGILLTMYDSRLNLARQVEEEAVDYFGEKVYDTVIPRNVRLSEAPSFGKPALLYDVVSAGAESYMKLAEELMDRCPPGSDSARD